MSTKSLNDEFSFSGEWFIPERPNIKLFGELRYEPDKIILKLLGSFCEIPLNIGANGNIQSYKIIYGITSNAQLITLVRSRQSSLNISFNSAGLRSNEEIRSQILYIGAHINDENLFNKANFRIPGLELWHANNSIQQTINHDADGGKLSRTFSFTNNSTDKFFVEEINSEIDFNNICETNCNPYKNANINIYSWITIKASEPRKFEWYLEQQIKITTMLTFLAGTPMTPDIITVNLVDGPHEVSAYIISHERNSCEWSDAHNFLILRTQINNDFFDILNSWFKIFPRINSCSHLALSILASKGLWVNVNFILLLQALEGLHRSLFNGEYMDNNCYDDVKNALIEALPESIQQDHRESLTSRIKYGNEYSLNKRLKELLSMLSPKIRKIIVGDEATIPRQWIDTRNYYTHWDAELKDKILNTQSMYDATVRIRMFLRCIYFKLMKIKEETIEMALNGSCELSQHLMQINSREKTLLNNRNE